MRLKAGGHDRINVQNNPVNDVDPYGLFGAAAAAAAANAAGSSGFGVGAAGCSSNEARVESINNLIQWMENNYNPNWFQDTLDLLWNDPINYWMGKGLGDKYGPLWDAPGMPGWNNPQNNEPHDPDFWKKPNNWDKMSKWQKFKWWLKKAAGAATGAGGVGS